MAFIVGWLSGSLWKACANRMGFKHPRPKIQESIALRVSLRGVVLNRFYHAPVRQDYLSSFQNDTYFE